MTREEQIREAATAYTKVRCPMVIGGERFNNKINSINANFIAGAEWADNNQPSPWISVEERLPEIGTTILEAYTIVVELQGHRKEDETIVLTKYDGNFIGDGSIEHMMGGTTCCTTHHWMPIPELAERVGR